MFLIVLFSILVLRRYVVLDIVMNLNKLKIMFVVMIIVVLIGKLVVGVVF